jgi:hypothetical protein
MFGAAFNDLGTDTTAADMPWQFAVLDAPVLIAYAATIVWLARRRGIATVTPAAPVVQPMPALVAAR